MELNDGNALIPPHEPQNESVQFTIPIFEEYEPHEILKVKFDYYVEDNGDWYDGQTLEDGVPYKEGGVEIFINDSLIKEMIIDGEEGSEVTGNCVEELITVLSIVDEADKEAIRDRLVWDIGLNLEGDGIVTFDFNLVTLEITNFKDTWVDENGKPQVSIQENIKSFKCKPILLFREYKIK